MSGRRCEAIVSVCPVTGHETLCTKPATWALLPSGWGWCDEHMERLAEDGDDVSGYDRVGSPDQSKGGGS